MNVTLPCSYRADPNLPPNPDKTDSACAVGASTLSSQILDLQSSASHNPITCREVLHSYLGIEKLGEVKYTKYLDNLQTNVCRRAEEMLKYVTLQLLLKSSAQGGLSLRTIYSAQKKKKKLPGTPRLQPDGTGLVYNWNAFARNSDPYHKSPMSTRPRWGGMAASHVPRTLAARSRHRVAWPQFLQQRRLGDLNAGCEGTSPIGEEHLGTGISDSSVGASIPPNGLLSSSQSTLPESSPAQKPFSLYFPATSIQPIKWSKSCDNLAYLANFAGTHTPSLSSVSQTSPGPLATMSWLLSIRARSS